ncbi:Cyclochlorotine biosynthesis T [Hyphodiscus hymeniophilus]|uniref:Cyclochlorotine biosynthesis T n=1 Tax=Hyphodiscus hymeniophilus TaxID=353542 RepID=A0A9P6VR10_9HELO|nr:Cyclochlorotine biosynthesis T [Hyphodiscus hymeniophilus]
MAQKTVLITGCSAGGIGDALAKAFHKNGLRVFATARNLAKVHELRAIGMDVFQLDVVDEVSVRQAVEKVKTATGGTLDFLVNNSGGGYNLPLLDTDVSEARKMFDLNVFSVIEVTKAFSPLLIASKGTIINIGSVAGKAPVPWQGYYNASKAAINLLSDQLRLELSPFGVTCICVVTGAIKTKFFENSPGIKLPADSIYAPGKDIIEPIAAGSSVQNMLMDVDFYAEGVVKNALKSNPTKNQWLGGGIWMIWSVATFGFSTVWDWIFPSVFNIIGVTKNIKAAQK